MRYPIVVEPATDETSYGVVIPDMPGCFSAGETLDEAIANAEEAAAAWIDAVLDGGGSVPEPSTLEALRARPEYEGWLFGMISVDPSLLDDSVERVNITLPRRVLDRLDAQARAHGLTRSAYIARMSLR
jgi:predicted RNase H-like HicB family nuclease